jgi:hypothetical protein
MAEQSYKIDKGINQLYLKISMKTIIRSSAKVLSLLFNILFIPAVAHAQWSTPADISPDAVSAILNESMGSCIGVSSDTVHVVWADRYSSTKGAVYYTQSPDSGLTWSTPIAISDTAGNAWNPAIAVNGSNIHVVWRVIDPLNNAHRASWYTHSFDGGNTWSTEVFLDSTADWPAIAVSGNIVYVVNDLKTSDSPYNTEIFFLRSLDKGNTWSTPQQITSALDRSEDEAITAQGSYIHMSWNDKRSGAMEFYYKESADYGVSWGPDVALLPHTVYGPGICANGADIDATCSMSPNGQHPQIHIEQSDDNGVTWGADKNLTNDTLNTYIYPYMVRDSFDLHMTYIKAGIGGQYLHSGDGGTTWDSPYTFISGNIGITPFPAYTGCALHIIYSNNADHHIYYVRNPTGNAGHCEGIITGTNPAEKINQVNVFPNPSSNNITVQSTEELGLIIIYNSIGEIIYQSGTNSTVQQIDLSKQPAGIYILQIISSKNFQRIKIVKE